MCFLHRSIFLCAILIYCVAGVQSQIEDNAIPVKDTISIENTIPIKSSATEILTDILPKRIIAGVDDEREKIKKTCWIKVNPTSSLPNLSSPLECARTCNDHEKSKICYYRFEAEVYSSLTKACDYCKPNATNTFCNNCQCVPVDGVERPILTINRMIPGPSIDVCEGDKIVVDVINNMDGEGLTIHWHGVFQKGSQYYDGPLLVTQCPIPAKSIFRYQFNADNAGTHFWHSHAGLQKMDGIVGSLTIRQSAKRDVNSYLYNFDLSRHSIVISDWMHELALSRSPGRLHDTKFQNPDSFLINGKGRYQDPGSGIVTNTEVFRVKRNQRYRFRMVNAFCTTCSSLLTVEGHNLTIIAADGVPVKPIVVNSIISVSAERYDFVINTNNRVDSYWIQLRAVGSCERTAIQQLAILKYDGASDVPTTPPPIFNASLPTGIVLNPLDDKCDRSRTDVICVSNMDSAIRVDKGIFTKKPDAKFYLSFKFYQYDPQNLFAPNHFYKFLVGPGPTHVAAVINDIMFQFPSSPPLSQLRDISPDTICNDTHKPDSCGDICSCTHIIELPYNGIIELVIIDETKVPNLHHPFHLHGYAFNIMSAGAPNNGTGTTVEEIKILDKKGLLPRRKFSPPFKDTIAVPNNGYAIIRFRANNPGYWFFHCHFIYHLTLGMANIFHVGGPDLPPVPQHFPKCGNFVPFISHS
ncbi:unnamed protein product [Lasius platythorax]|uniref:Uncharacterized protein n=1 Tax=Lasius platythorax TaxID=488582 RepID=A0AAV2NY63_9HYME